MLLWMRLAIVGVIVAAIAAAVIAVTSFLNAKDKQIVDLKDRVKELTLENQKLAQSAASLQADRDKKSEELARAQLEQSRLQMTDTASNKRANELERKLNARERLEQVERLRNSRRAELVLTVVNKSAKCDLENFFETGGACKNGVWVKDGERTVPRAAPSVAQKPAEGQAEGGSSAPQ